MTIALKQVQQDPEPLSGDLPAEVRALIGRALAKDAGTRFADGAAFVAAIDDVQAGRPLPVTPPTVAVPADGPLPEVVPSPRPADPETLQTGTVTRPPAGRRRNRAAMVLLPLLGLLAGAGIAVALLLALADDTGGTPAEAAEQRDSGSIVLDADEYIGRPVDEVVRRLTRLGLDVQPRGEARDDVVPDQVTDVEPTGEPLSPGDTVVVRYATEDASGGGGGAVDRPAVTGAAGGGSTPVPEEEPVPVDDPAPQTVPRTSAPVTPTLAGTPTSSRSTASSTTSQSTGSETSTPATTSTTPTTSATTETPPPE